MLKMLLFVIIIVIVTEQKRGWSEANTACESSSVPFLAPEVYLPRRTFCIDALSFLLFVLFSVGSNQWQGRVSAIG